MTPDLPIVASTSDIAEQPVAPRHLARISQRHRLHWEGMPYE